MQYQSEVVPYMGTALLIGWLSPNWAFQLKILEKNSQYQAVDVPYMGTFLLTDWFS